MASSPTEVSDTPEEPKENLDTLDGFRKDVKRKISSLLCGMSKGDDRVIERTPSVSTTSSQDFAEAKTAIVHRGAGDTDSDIYDFNYPKRGLAIIINNEEFSGSSDFDDRPGSSYDASSLYHSFAHLGFNVMLRDNLAAWQMVELLRQAAKEYDHENADCVACSILTHGDQTLSDREYERMGSKVRQDLLFGTDGKAVSTKTVIDIFNDKYCPGLQGKPRLFFLQACRGTALDHGQDIHVLTPKPHGISGRDVRDVTDGGGGSQAESSTVDLRDKGLVDVEPFTERQTSLSSSVDPPGYPKYADRLDAMKASDDEEPQEAGLESSMEQLGLGSCSESQATSHVDARGYDGEESDTDATGVPWRRTRNLPVSPPPLYRDCLVMYATPPGHFAWRRKNGAWFIQSLSKVLDSRHLGNLSLVRALLQVGGYVARNYQSENPRTPSMHAKKEMPVIETMLVKDVYLKKKGKV